MQKNEEHYSLTNARNRCRERKRSHPPSDPANEREGIEQDKTERDFEGKLAHTNDNRCFAITHGVKGPCENFNSRVANQTYREERKRDRSRLCIIKRE